jgi:hypothetical protein
VSRRNAWYLQAEQAEYLADALTIFRDDERVSLAEPLVPEAVHNGFGMSGSNRISEGTKRKLVARKRDGESFDDLLDQLARTEKVVKEMDGCLANRAAFES